MARQKKTKQVAEFGDFQTPSALAHKVCSALTRRRLKPASIIEPTCGHGSFLLAALERFPAAKNAIGLEINSSYVEITERLLSEHGQANRAKVLQADFFTTDWEELLDSSPDPLLIIGNPPWITNAELGVLGSANLPQKSNFQKRGGFDAITGKANFDISEWMLIKLLDWLDNRTATLAMLCKTAVARKALIHAWKNGLSIRNASMHGIDAEEFFGASVDACLLVCGLAPKFQNFDCDIYERLGDAKKKSVIGYRDDRLLANVENYERWKHLRGEGPHRWRSGIKHDCSRVMELRKDGKFFVNGLGERFELEAKYVYPMLKSSQVANGSTEEPERWMLVTQTSTGEDTSSIAATAPKTWRYLQDHGDLLDKRGSSIYRKRPRFSIFGVGDYSFAPYKVAISGFYKHLSFAVIGSVDGKPIVLDDTCYFVDCYSKQEATLIASLLNSNTGREFVSAFIFWDSKRPITVDVLKQLDLLALAETNGQEQAMQQCMKQRPERVGSIKQGELFPV